MPYSCHSMSHRSNPREGGGGGRGFGRDRGADSGDWRKSSDDGGGRGDRGGARRWGGRGGGGGGGGERYQPHHQHQHHDDMDEGGWGRGRRPVGGNMPPEEVYYGMRGPPSAPRPPSPPLRRGGEPGGRGNGGGRGGLRRDAPLQYGRPEGRGVGVGMQGISGRHHQQGDVLEVESQHLPNVEMEEGKVYQGFIYSIHDLHGFFIYFGHHHHPHAFRRFGPHGRLSRQGLPPGLIARMQKRMVARGASAKPSDLMQVQVKSKTEDREGRLLVELLLVPDKKLLILDLNGVLFNRYPPHDDRRYRHEVERRPYMEEFLRVCFQEYDVAVWSCCKRETMEVDEVFTPDQRTELVFIHDYSHTTNLWPRHSVVAPEKPLFVKDLPQLWLHYDRVLYGEAGTVLLDNHLEKFEPNPVGTCIIVPDFLSPSQEEQQLQQEEEDSLLSPAGPLMQHLVALAHCPSPRAYMAAHPTCPFFPTAHPVNPRLMEDQARREAIQEYCRSPCVPPEHSVEWYLNRHESPGPRALQLRRRDVATLVASKYFVCEKSDGVRYLLYVRPEQQQQAGGGFLLDRGLTVRTLRAAEQVTQVLCPGGGATLLDGELVHEQFTDTTTSNGHVNDGDGNNNHLGRRRKRRRRTTFLVFDVIRLDGEDVGSRPSLQARLACLQDKIRPSTAPLSFSLPATEEEGEGEEEGTLVHLRVKQMHNVQQQGLDKVAARLKPAAASQPREPSKEGEREEEVEEEGGDRAHHYRYVDEEEGAMTWSDGLVFTPAHATYYQYQVFKFKPPEGLTVDFKVLPLQDIRLPPPPRRRKKPATPGTKEVEEQQQEQEEASSTPTPTTTAPLYLVISDKDVAFSTLTLTREQAQHLLGPTTTSTGVVVECGFLPGTGCWELKAIRIDKARPNSIQTAWNTLEALTEKLDLPALLTAVQDATTRLPAAAAGGEEADYNIDDGDDHTARVAAHYDSRQEERWSQGGLKEGAAIGNMRRLSNWIKGMFIDLACGGRLTEFTTTGDGGDGVWAMDTFTPRANPFTEAAPPPSTIHKKQHDNHHRSRGDQGPVRVLDLACGRGGDVTKWVLHHHADTYVGMDISPASITECQKRLQVLLTSKGRPRVGRAVVKDAEDEDLADVAKAEGLTDTFSVVSMQFAVHYLCSSPLGLTSLFTSASRLLSPGGLLLLTTMDQRALHHHLSSSSSPTFGNSVYSVRFPPDTSPSDILGRLGVSYSFTLTSAVEDCNEYVVDLGTVCRLAKEVGGMEVVAVANFGDFAVSCQGEFGEALRRFGVGVVTDAEWEAVQLYCLLAFRKTRP